MPLSMFLTSVNCSGNQWALHTLSVVMLCGMVAALLPMALKFVLHDDHMLGREAEALTATEPTSNLPVPRTLEAQACNASAVPHSPFRFTSSISCDPSSSPHITKDRCQVPDDWSESSETFLTTSFLGLHGSPTVQSSSGSHLVARNASTPKSDVLEDTRYSSLTRDGTAHGDHASKEAGCAGQRQMDAMIRCELEGRSCGATSSHRAHLLHSTCPRLQRKSTDDGQQVLTSQKQSPASPRGCPSDSDSSVMEPLLPVSAAAAYLSPQTDPTNASMLARRSIGDGTGIGGSRLAFYVPLLICLSDVTAGLAAGMTIKFFPIFFMDEVRKFQPTPLFPGQVLKGFNLSLSTYLLHKFLFLCHALFPCVTKTSGRTSIQSSRIVISWLLKCTPPIF
jgi:hypothetical protein